MSESVEELVHNDADLTQFSGIGKAIAGAIREIVQNGNLRGMLDTLRSQVTPEVASPGCPIIRGSILSVFGASTRSSKSQLWPS